MRTRKITFIIFLICTGLNCQTPKGGGAIPVYMDRYIASIEKRAFVLQQEIEGLTLEYQNSYKCKKDSIIYNSTLILETYTNDTITVYTPCFYKDIHVGEKVKIVSIEYDESFLWFKREIYKPFPKSSNKYGYWECISCKYPNTVGEIQRGN